MHIVVTVLALKRLTVPAVIFAPEKSGLATGIPIAMAYALEEQADAESVPVSIEIQTKLITWSDIAQTVQIAVVVKRCGTHSDAAVTVKVYELKISRILAEIVSILMVIVYHPIVCLFIAGKDTRRAEAPYLTHFLAFVESKDVARHVVVLTHPGAAVPQTAFHAVAELLAAKIEGVAPTKRHLPALCLEGTVVASGGGSTVNGRKFRAGDYHVVVVAHIIISAEGEAAAKEIGVDSYIISGNRLPCKVIRHYGRIHGIRRQASVYEGGRFADRNGFQKTIRPDIGISRGPYISAYLEVIQPLPAPLHKRFLA